MLQLSTVVRLLKYTLILVGLPLGYVYNAQDEEVYARVTEDSVVRLAVPEWLVANSNHTN